MTDNLFYNVLLISWLILSAVIFIALFFIVAPYGRHARGGWGLPLHSTVGWIVMEAASPTVFLICYLLGSSQMNPISIIFLLLWEAHYTHRSLIYPFSIKSTKNTMPLSVVFSGIFFNFVNAYLNGYYLFVLADPYPIGWLSDPRFIVGTAVFITGFIINRQADFVLSRLRKHGDKHYTIPHGGLYNCISCPNYLGEIIIWTGWAIATWSLAGLSFALWTVANLLPRARAHHNWYHENFPDYPQERKALIPGIW
jgi:protein-S-isoprenylcysteine O-methyltransferase Ste14